MISYSFRNTQIELYDCNIQLEDYEQKELALSPGNSC